MKKSGLKATSLRLILVTTILLIICASSVGFYFAKSFLVNFEAEVSSKAPTETTADQDSQALNQLRNDVETHKLVAAKANNIFASSQGYETQIVTDLKKYTLNNNIQMSEYSFSQTDSNSILPTITGTQIISAKITLENPVEYTSFIKFLKAVENNLPKMQVNSIAIARDTSSSNSITVEPLTIEVYVGSTK